MNVVSAAAVIALCAAIAFAGDDGESLEIQDGVLLPGGHVEGGPFTLHAIAGNPFALITSDGGSFSVTSSWFPCVGGCTGDLTQDGLVNSADLGLLIGAWGTDGSIVEGSDLNGDGIVDAADLGLLVGAWGPCS